MPTPDCCFKDECVNTTAPESDLSEPLLPGLYIVATPIGNLGDVTLRALDVLRRTSVIACEDTRVTGKLLSHFDIDTRMTIMPLRSSAPGCWSAPGPSPSRW